MFAIISELKCRKCLEGSRQLRPCRPIFWIFFQDFSVAAGPWGRNWIPGKGGDREVLDHPVPLEGGRWTAQPVQRSVAAAPVREIATPRVAA